MLRILSVLLFCGAFCLPASAAHLAPEGVVAKQVGGLDIAHQSLRYPKLAQVPMTGAGQGAPGGGTGYQGPGDVVGGAVGFYSVRGYTGAYSSGSNNAVTTVTASGGETCDFFIATNGNIGLAHNCTGGSNTHTVAMFCATSCAINTAIDQTVSGNNGVQVTSANQPTMTISSSPFTGFNTSFHISDANSTYWLLGTGSVNARTFTWILWLNPSTFSVTQNLGILGGDNVGPTLETLVSGKLRLVNASTSNLCDSATALTANTWVQVAVSWDNSAGTCKMYINHVLDVTNTTTTQSFTSANTYIGGGFGLQEWDGDIAEVMIYGSVLTQTNITNIFNNATSNP